MILLVIIAQCCDFYFLNKEQLCFKFYLFNKVINIIIFKQNNVKTK